MIQINQNIYNNNDNHKERVRTSGIGLRPSGLKWSEVSAKLQGTVRKRASKSLSSSLDIKFSSYDDM